MRDDISERRKFSDFFRSDAIYPAVCVCVGLMPYNLVCVQTGVVLSDLSSLDDVLSWSVVLKLLLIACAALLPSALIHRYRNTHTAYTHPEHKDRWCTLHSCTHTHTLVHADSVYNALLNVWVCIRRAMLHYNMVCLYSFVFVLFFNIMWSHDKWTNRNTSNELVIQSCLSAEWSAKIQFINKMIWEEVFVLEVIKSGVFFNPFGL